jgi:hypothetical protein
MEPGILAKISASPSLAWVGVAIGFHVVNVFLGAFMGFMKKTPVLIRAHRYLYFGILFALVLFLVLNQIHGSNSLWEYLIGAYFITVIPLSKRWDVMIHAFFSIVGLTFLPVLALLQLF